MHTSKKRRKVSKAATDHKKTDGIQERSFINNIHMFIN